MSYLRRRIYEYRAGPELGRNNPAVLPYSTWKRWLANGKITEEKLLELGIYPRQRRRTRKGQQPNNPPLRHQQERNQQHHVISDEGGEDGITPTNEQASLNDSTESHQDNSIPRTSSDGTSAQLSETSDDELSSVGNSERVDSSIDSLRSASSLSGSVEGGSEISGLLDDDEDSEQHRISIARESRKIGVEALSKPLVAGLKVTKFETMLMISHLAMRHSLTDAFIEDLMTFVNAIVDDANAIPASKYLFHKLFLFGSQPVIHFFCPDCAVYLGSKATFNSKNVTCDQCNWSQTVSSLNDNNYFVTLSVKDQLKSLLSRPGIKLVSRSVSNERVVSDLYHGRVYRKLMKGVLSDEDALTISISTDGSPVYKNGKNTLHSIHFHLNEIPPEERFEVENIFLAGLWFSKRGDPNLQIFLKPLIDEIISLQNVGIVWKKPDGKMVESPVYLTCVCADSVSRPKIQNVAQFSSSFGCSYCMHPNTPFVHTKPVKSRGGVEAMQVPNSADSANDSEGNEGEVLVKTKKVMRYLDGTYYPYRTDKEVRLHMDAAMNSVHDHIYGVKGPSVLALLTTLNLVFSVPIDYMHAILIGVTKGLAGLWFDRKNIGNRYCIGLQVHFVDRRLTQITLPSNMARPRPMSDRAHWKAKEWRNFVLYYGLPCLYQILPAEYYNHFKKLVTAIFIFTKESLTYDEGEEAEILVKQFVAEYQVLYGEINMVYNTHLVGHLGKQVSQMGPLWAYSLFPFESANGRLVKLVKGTRGVATQIARKYLMTNTICKLLRGTYTVRNSVLDFCSQIVGYKYTKSYQTIQGVTLLGRPVPIELSNEQKQAFLSIGINFPGNVTIVHNKAVVNGIVYCSRDLSKQNVFNDSCVRLVDGSFAILNYIVHVSKEDSESEVWCALTEINIVSNISLSMPPHIKECALDSFGCVKVIPFQNIRKKCVFISWDEKNYIAEVPNTYEKS